MQQTSTKSDSLDNTAGRSKFELLGILGGFGEVCVYSPTGTLAYFKQDEAQTAERFEKLLNNFCAEEGIRSGFKKETDSNGDVKYTSRAIAAALSLNYDFREGGWDQRLFIDISDENLLRLVSGAYQRFGGAEDAAVIIDRFSFTTMKQLGLAFAKLGCPSAKIYSNNPTSQPLPTSNILIFSPTQTVADRLGIKKEVSIIDQDYFGLPVYDGTQVQALMFEADLSPNRISLLDKYEAEEHLPKIAFLLGIMGRGHIGYKSEFWPNESDAQEIYSYHAFDLAKQFGLTSAKKPSDTKMINWEPELLNILKQFVVDGIYPRSDHAMWDDTYAKAFLTGSYCRFGHEKEIGFVATTRAEHMAELLFQLRANYRITHLARNTAPGGSSVTLYEDLMGNDPIADAIIAAADSELRAIKE